MDTAAQKIFEKTRLVIFTQAVFTLLIGAGFLLVHGTTAAMSALFGGAISVVSALQLSRSVMRAGNLAAQDQKKSMAVLYFGAFQRFVIVLALLGVGLALLKLDPLPLGISFIAAQLAYMISMRRMS